MCAVCTKHALSAMQAKRNRNKRGGKMICEINKARKRKNRREETKRYALNKTTKPTSLTIWFRQYKRDHLQEMTANYMQWIE